MQKTILIGIAVSLIASIFLGCIKEPASPENCNPPYAISEKEKFGEVKNIEEAFNILISLELGWSKDTQAYKDYKNSNSTDVKFEEIPIQGTIHDGAYPTIFAYVLKEQNAIDANGQVYRRMGCI